MGTALLAAAAAVVVVVVAAAAAAPLMPFLAPKNRIKFTLVSLAICWIDSVYFVCLFWSIYTPVVLESSWGFGRAVTGT